VQGAHVKAVFGSVLDLGERIFLPQSNHINAGANGRFQDGLFSRRAAQFVLQTVVRVGVDFCFIAQRGHLEHTKHGRVSHGVEGSLADLEPLSVDLDIAMPTADGQNAHLIAGDGAGLIETDYLHGAECFRRLQVTDDDVMFFQPSHGQSEGGGRRRRQSLGNGRGRQSYRRADHIEQAEAADQAHDKHQAADRARQQHQVIADFAELPLDGCFRGAGLLQ